MRPLKAPVKNTPQQKKKTLKRALRWQNKMAVAVLSSSLVAGAVYMSIPYILQAWNTIAKATQNTWVQITDNAGFKINDILIEGRENIPFTHIQQILNLEEGDPLFTLSPYEIKEKIEHLPWVRSAIVQRHLSGNIYIRLVEKKPTALWQFKQQFFLLDDQGQVISVNNIKDYVHLPLFVGEDAPLHTAQMIQTLEKHPAIKERVTAATWVGKRRWNLRIDDQLDVLFPEGNIEASCDFLENLQKSEKILDRALSIVDLRSIPDKLILRRKQTVVPLPTTEDKRI